MRFWWVGVLLTIAGAAGARESLPARHAAPPASAAECPHPDTLAAHVRAMTRWLQDFTADSLRCPVPVACLSADSARLRYRGLCAEELESLRRSGCLAVFQHLDLKPDTSLGSVEPPLAWYGLKNRRIWVTAGQNLAGNELDELLLHELVHAYDDQKYGLEAVLKAGTWDGSQAHKCVIEGLATWAEVRYALALKKTFWTAGDFSIFYDELRAISIDKTIKDAKRARRRGSRPAPGPREYSLLGAMHYYWYYMGLAFADQAAAAGGKTSLLGLLQGPPVSMEQILQPRRYLLENLRPSVFRPGPVDSVWAGAKEINRDAYGEVLLRLYLETHGQGKRAGTLSDGWDGDLLLLLERDSGGPVLLWWTLWDAPWSAAGIEEAYGATLRARGIRKSLGPGLWRGADAGRRWAVWREECRVLILENAPAADFETLRAAMSRVMPEPMPAD
jgi:hypothetical protein